LYMYCELPNVGESFLGVVVFDGMKDDDGKDLRELWVFKDGVEGVHASYPLEWFELTPIDETKPNETD